MGHQFEELSSKILEAAVAVHTGLGPGFVEPVYQKAMEVALRHRAIPFQRQKEVELFFEGPFAGERRYAWRGNAGATGEISRHPTDPNILGIKNTGATAWTSATGNGATVTVPPGKNLKIAVGTRILFGSLALEIQTY